MRLFFALFQDPTVDNVSQVRSLTGISALDETLQTVINYAPKILGALLLLIVAWIVASVIRSLARRGLKALNFDERLNSGMAESGTQVVKTLSDVVYWIVFLCFVPAILGVLGLTGILEPIQAMLTNVLGYLPNVLGAALIFILGMLVANIVRQLVTTFLTNVGINTFAENHSVKADFTSGGIAGLIGTIVYALILLAVLSAALSTLRVDAISRPIEGVVNPILGSIPNIFGAAILLVLAYLIARVIRGIVRDVLAGMGFNKIPSAIGLSNLPAEGDRSASAFVGHLAFLAIMFYAVIESANILRFELLAEAVQTIAVLGGRIVAGVVILAIGMYVANIVVTLIKDSGITNANLLATVARVSILFFVGAMALSRMGVADDIVSRAFTLLLGAVAVAAAIAFGFGGREFASNALEKFNDTLSKPPQQNPPAAPRVSPLSDDSNPLDL